jgi:hypothetical protein
MSYSPFLCYFVLAPEIPTYNVTCPLFAPISLFAALPADQPAAHRVVRKPKLRRTENMVSSRYPSAQRAVRSNQRSHASGEALQSQRRRAAEVLSTATCRQYTASPDEVADRKCGCLLSLQKGRPPVTWFERFSPCRRHPKWGLGRISGVRCRPWC